MTLASTTLTHDDHIEAIEAYHGLGWTDGLPVIPPTPEAVEAMLAAGGVDGSEVLGTVPTRQVTVTAEKAGVNAVMAGCLPEHFPVVLAAVRALLQPLANPHSTTATLAGSSHAVIVNGPARDRLGIFGGQACLGPGFRANASIGRALRLVIRNVLRTVPGGLDRATFSSPLRYSFCFAENEQFSDWTPLHVQLGYQRDDSVVTVQSVMRLLPFIEFATEPEGIVESLSDIARTNGMGRDDFVGDARSVVVLIGQEHQLRMLDSGWTKEAVQAALWEQMTQPTRGKIDKQLVLAHPANVLVVAAGGPGLAESCVITPHLSAPTHERVVFP